MFALSLSPANFSLWSYGYLNPDITVLLDSHDWRHAMEHWHICLEYVPAFCLVLNRQKEKRNNKNSFVDKWCYKTQTQLKASFVISLTKEKEIVLDYLKSVLVYPEVSCCHVTAIIPCATKRASSSPWFWTFLLWSRRSFCLLVLGSYRVELGSNEGRKMYWKPLKRFATIMTMLRQMRWLFLLSLVPQIW